MFGIVTWAAVVGNLPPYYANRLLVNAAKRKGINSEVIGSIKVYSSFVIFPLWWLIISFGAVLFFLGDNSPIMDLLISHWLLVYLTKVPLILAGIILLISWPLAGRANLKLHANATRSWRAIKRWKRWQDDTIEWDNLRAEQISIAKTLTSLGDEMILPGDDDWENPPTGIDDADVVKLRS